MNWQSVIGLISTITLSFPVIVILTQKLYRHRNYLVLLIYTLIALFYNLITENYIPVSTDFSRVYTIINNMLDVPLMMTVLLIFATSLKQKKQMRFLAWFYLGYESLVLLISFLTGKDIIRDVHALRDTIAFMTGPGLLLILYYSSRFFSHRINIAVKHQKAAGKAAMISAILFVYLSFSFIYVVHYVLQSSELSGTFLIFYLTIIIFNSTMAIGLFIESKRIRKLTEVQITRKELSEIFSYTKPAPPDNERADSFRFDH